MSNLIRKRSVVVLSSLLLMLGLAACGAQNGQEIPALLEPVGAELESIAAAYGPIEISTTYVASVIPETMEFSFDMDGRVKAVHSYMGQSVSAGDVILEIERVNEADIERLETEREDLTAAWEHEQTILGLELDKTELIAQSLRASGASTQDKDYQQIQVERAKLNLSQAEERYQLSLSRIDEQLTNLHIETERMQIVAPVDGQIIYLATYNEGDTIQAYDTVMVLADTSKLILRSEFVSDYFLNAAVKLTAYINGETYPLEAQEMNWADYMTIVMNEGTPYSYYDILDAEAGELNSGSYAVLNVVAEEAADSLRIPVNSLYRDGSTRYVYVVVDNVREKRTVEIGISNSSWVEILDGLEEGEQVYIHD